MDVGHEPLGPSYKGHLRAQMLDWKQNLLTKLSNLHFLVEIQWNLTLVAPLFKEYLHWRDNTVGFFSGFFNDKKPLFDIQGTPIKEQHSSKLDATFRHCRVSFRQDGNCLYNNFDFVPPSWLLVERGGVLNPDCDFSIFMFKMKFLSTLK